MIYGTIGTVLHGTMRSVDLLDAFADELERLIVSNIDKDLGYMTGQSLIDCAALIADARRFVRDDATNDDEAATDVVAALFDALDTFAPQFTSFGAHEGDGSDYGFWPCDLDDAVHEGELTKLDHLPDHIAVVNDHGNVTVYAIEATELWSMV